MTAAAAAMLGDWVELGGCYFYLSSLMILFAFLIASNPAGIRNRVASDGKRGRRVERRRFE